LDWRFLYSHSTRWQPSLAGKTKLLHLSLQFFDSDSGHILHGNSAGEVKSTQSEQETAPTCDGRAAKMANSLATKPSSFSTLFCKAFCTATLAFRQSISSK
jgi:hypothetical protein